MKILSILAAGMLAVAPVAVSAGEQERGNQAMGGVPQTLPPLENIPNDATAAAIGIGLAALIGGAAAGLASGGGSNGPVGTTSTTSTTTTTN